MNKISPVVRELVKSDQFLSYGLSERLLNLTRVARYLRARVSAVSKKAVKPSSILVALSRIQRQVDRKATFRAREFPIESLSVYSDLVIATVSRTPRAQSRISTFFDFVQKQAGYLTVTQGLTETMLVFDGRYVKDFKRMVNADPLFFREHLAAVVLKFDAGYVAHAGFFYRITQPFAWMNVPILEMSSSTSELALYVDEEYTQIVFDTLLYQHGRARLRRAK